MEHKGPKHLALIVPPELDKERLDLVLVQMAPSEIPTRAAGQKLIRSGLVRVNKKVVMKTGTRLTAGSLIESEVPAPVELAVVPEPIPLELIYEDADLVVVNKPRGLVVHPGAGHWQGTLVGALLAHCHDLSGIGGVLRPGIVHRLDKDTSGVMVVAKNDFAHEALARMLKAHAFLRQYLALVHGHLESGSLTTYIGRHPKERKKMAVLAPDSPGARLAITHWQEVARFPGYSLLKVTLETGRTHQIRVHMAHLGHPVVGDPVYGPKRPQFANLITGQALHAYTLGLRHPRRGTYMRFTARPPADLKAVLGYLARLG